jgi:threonine dehydratase
MNAIYVEDGREPAIAAGAGTMAMEITRWARPISSMLVPLGNGGAARRRWLLVSNTLSSDTHCRRLMEVLIRKMGEE